MTKRTDAGTQAHPTPAGLIRRNFYGAVVLTDWMPLPNGGQVIAAAGTCSVLEDKEALGFEVNARDSKWCVRVAGKTTSITVPGCKVRMVAAPRADRQLRLLGRPVATEY